MTPAPSPQHEPKPPESLTQREEAILRAIAKLRYVTSLDVSHLPVCAGLSASYLRKILSALSGGKDLTPNQYLCRFPRPQTSAGSSEKVYALGARGRDYLTRVLRERVQWWYGPAKVSSQSFSYLLHQLTLSRLVCAAWHWSQRQSAFTLVHVLMSYEVAQTAPTVTLQTADQQRTVTVVPDAWLCFEDTAGEKYPILLEIDRGTEYQERFKAHVLARIRFLRSGSYERVFGTPAVSIAYVATGLTPEYRDCRLRTMRQWTQEAVAAEMTGEHRQAWMGLFRFTSLSYATMYEDTPALFLDAVWLRPDALPPVPLFTQEPQQPQGEAHDYEAHATG
jgi:hypothetical protein